MLDGGSKGQWNAEAKATKAAKAKEKEDGLRDIASMENAMSQAQSSEKTPRAPPRRKPKPSGSPKASRARTAAKTPTKRGRGKGSSSKLEIPSGADMDAGAAESGNEGEDSDEAPRPRDDSVSEDPTDPGTQKCNRQCKKVSIQNTINTFRNELMAVNETDGTALHSETPVPARGKRKHRVMALSVSFLSVLWKHR